ncbi:MAG: hypothetical protein V3T83_07945 [Acidobacteriota bacterium]
MQKELLSFSWTKCCLLGPVVAQATATVTAIATSSAAPRAQESACRSTPAATNAPAFSRLTSRPMGFHAKAQRRKEGNFGRIYSFFAFFSLRLCGFA